MKEKIKNILVGCLLTALVFTAIPPMVASAATHTVDEMNFAVPIVSKTSIPDGYTGIYTTADLDNIRNNLSGKYILMNDIVFSESDFQVGGAFYNEGKGWEPIGDGKLNQPFSGILDGNGYRISNLTVNIKNTSDGIEVYDGIFELSSGEVINLVMDNVDITDRQDGSTGAIAGRNDGKISNCMVFDSVHGGGTIGTGGITGINYGTISFTKNYSEVFDLDGPVGGIAGKNYGTIEYCSNIGNVIGPDTHYNGFAGGITAENRGVISRCYNAGSLVANIVGGIAAANMSETSYIDNCFNTGRVQLSKGCDDGNAGGISASSYHLSNCYSTGLIVDPDNSGQNTLGGIAPRGTNKLTNCYFLKGTGKNEVGTSLTYSEMGSKSSYDGFDFSSVWVMSPTLKRPVLRDLLPDTDDISYELNGGNLPSSAPTAYMDGSNRLLPIPTKEGYSFRGWYADASFDGKAIREISDGSVGAVQYYAKWVPEDNGNQNSTNTPDGNPNTGDKGNGWLLYGAMFGLLLLLAMMGRRHDKGKGILLK